MAKQAAPFSHWLDVQLSKRRWIPADLVRASGVKPNGRPVIDAPRVGSWLKGERPGPELIVALANALGLGAPEVFRAAGYPVDAERAEADDSRPPSRIAAMLRDTMREEGLSQSDLEDRADMPRGALTRFLAGEVDDDPSEETRLQLGRAVGLTQAEVDEAIEADLGLEPGDLRDIDLWRRLPLNQRRLVRELLAAISDDEGRSRRGA